MKWNQKLNETILALLYFVLLFLFSSFSFSLSFYLSFFNLSPSFSLSFLPLFHLFSSSTTLSLSDYQTSLLVYSFWVPIFLLCLCVPFFIIFSCFVRWEFDRYMQMREIVGNVAAGCLPLLTGSGVMGWTLPMVTCRLWSLLLNPHFRQRPLHRKTKVLISSNLFDPA